MLLFQRDWSTKVGQTDYNYMRAQLECNAEFLVILFM